MSDEINSYQEPLNFSETKSPLDLTFIINEPGKTLRDRFEQLIKDCKYFDCLVGYFYISGFHTIYKALQSTDKIRILVGIGISKETFDLIKTAETEETDEEIISFATTKTEIENLLENEIANAGDDLKTEEGVKKFVDWIKEGKLEIKALPSRKVHAKLYIMTFKEGDRDIGRVITGSSNFTQSGLVDNFEFNVELKNPSDYNFAIQSFNNLWANAVDVSEQIVQTITKKTYLNENITPYELFLKFLYEYFRDELSRREELFTKYLPQDFLKLEYQEQAVLNAKKILESYGGVFISDVVGLGKTYITAMLISQLDGRTIVIAPPSLLNEENPGSWKNVFYDFHLPAKFFSIGKLEDAIEEIEFRGEEYKNIVIDESHRFRNESTISYETLTEICRGKRIILVSATPFNNSPGDILSQIKLFQNPRKSTIPDIENLEEFFKSKETLLKKISRDKDYDKYLETVKENSKHIREKVLKYLMVRRTRQEIEKYFEDDLKKNNVKFPEVENPHPFYYQLNRHEDEIFMRTLKLITKDFKYARYMPLLYLKEKISPLEQQSQKNLAGFMKVLLVKRLESSFYAFKKTLERFIKSYELFIDEFKNGNVYISKKYINKIFEFLQKDDDEAIQKLIDEGKAEKYSSEDFKDEFEKHLESDLNILKRINSMWETIERDPKLDTLLYNLKNHDILKNNKIIVFTESKETAEYLTENINKSFDSNIALLFHGYSDATSRNKVIENFDARARNKKDDFHILVTTDVLSEGVNLHRSNIVINYDIPWNPTKLMQRAGRINRLDTPHDKIYIFNFFPTIQSDNEIELTNIARSKIESFLTLLGGDSAILTEGEPVRSHELFDKLLSKKTLLEDDGEESELKYLRIIEDIRNNNPELFEKIKKLPKKARSGKKYFDNGFIQSESLITFFKKGKLMKFFISDKKITRELDFLTAAKILESFIDENRAKIPLEDYYELLDKNKTAFFNATMEEIIYSYRRGSKDNRKKLIIYLKAILNESKQLTEDQEDYIKRIIKSIEEGLLPKQTIKRTLTALKKLEKESKNALKVIEVLQKEIPERLLKGHYAENIGRVEEKREVILSLYLGDEKHG